MLESLWSFRIKFPQEKGATFAGQYAANQHNLRRYGQIDVSLSEISNTALQQGHVLGRPPVKSFIDP